MKIFNICILMLLQTVVPISEIHRNTVLSSSTAAPEKCTIDGVDWKCFGAIAGGAQNNGVYKLGKGDAATHATHVFKVTSKASAVREWKCLEMSEDIPYVNKALNFDHATCTMKGNKKYTWEKGGGIFAKVLGPKEYHSTVHELDGVVIAMVPNAKTVEEVSQQDITKAAQSIATSFDGMMSGIAADGVLLADWTADNLMISDAGKATAKFWRIDTGGTCFLKADAPTKTLNTLKVKMHHEPMKKLATALKLSKHKVALGLA